MNSWGGWRRLWLVVSVLIGIPAAFLGYTENSTVYMSVPMSSSDRDLPKEQRDKVFWDRIFAHERMAECDVPTVKFDTWWADEGGASCQRKASEKMQSALLWAAIPAVVLWLIGGAIGWIWRGFRPQAKA